MSEAESLVIRNATPADLEGVAPLWHALYAQQRREGMQVEVSPDGHRRWVESLTPVLGRFALVVVAEADGRLIAFVAGRIRSLPLYFGGERAGFVSEGYVEESYRRRGIGTLALERVLTWFEEQQIRRVELQVVVNNDDARRFYRRHGWSEELLQLVKHTAAGKTPD